MSQLDEQEDIDELRKRLYSRGDNFSEVERHTVSDIKVDVSRDWNIPTTLTDEPEPVAAPKRSRRYRWYILLGSLLFLFVTMAATGYYMFSGGNQISSDNIALTIAAPTTLGGGERFDAQLAITNQNAVAIESATLIVTYPTGSQTAEEPVEDLFEQRIWVDRLEPGESKNVPLAAIVYGEEGDEKQVRAQLEYRIIDSDSMFYKDAEPHNFRIISSPVTLQVRSLRKVSAGQEVEVEIRVTSNTSNEYTNLLVSTEYPNGFTYQSAEPSPAFNQNVWRLETLKPEETKVIKIKGTINGLANAAMRLSASVGPSNPDNQFIAGATLTDSYTEFVIERPFIDVSLAIDGKRQNPVILEAGSSANVDVEVTNTIDESVYDMVVEVVPEGSAVRGANITTTEGFYDSNRGLVRFDSSSVSGFSQFRAGETENLSLNIAPGVNQSTATFSVTVNIYGRRVNDPSAQEQLFGTTKVEARYASSVSLENALVHVAGPIPPVVGQETEYQVILTANAGTNEVTSGLLKTTLPSYVEWLDNYQASGMVEYNPVSRELTWQVGSINGAQSKDLRFMISFLPSQSQVGTKPTLVNRPTFTATDRFTNTSLSANLPNITSEIGANGEFEVGSGNVQAQE